MEVAWEQQRQFVADASQELKTPLTVILSNAQMLSENGEDPQLRGKLTANILTVSQQMKGLISKLLNSAQVDQGTGAMRFFPFDLSETVSNALLPFDSVFYEREMELDSAIQPDIRMSGSQPHVIQVVDILLDNAQKYSIVHGRTCVTLQLFWRICLKPKLNVRAMIRCKHFIQKVWSLYSPATPSLGATNG